MKAASIGDYRELARKRLPRFAFDYIDGGSYAEVTLRRNIMDLEDVALRQRVLRNVEHVDLRTEVFGERLAMPVVLAPIGLAGLNARRGEVQAIRAANAAGVPFCLSTLSVCSLAEVTHASSKPPWFQLYMVRDQAFLIALLATAERLGCPALMLTVDMPVPGSRYRDSRSGLAVAPGLSGGLRRFGQALLRPRWAWNVGLQRRPLVLGNVAPVLNGSSGLDDFFAWMRGNFDPRVSWDDIEWLRSRWKRPLILKGILDPEDALKAVRVGVDGIVVSNHGGRQLDGVPSTARALPAIADAVGRRLTVLADGGVRSGLDFIDIQGIFRQLIRSTSWCVLPDIVRLIRRSLRFGSLLAGMRPALQMTLLRRYRRRLDKNVTDKRNSSYFCRYLSLIENPIKSIGRSVEGTV